MKKLLSALLCFVILLSIPLPAEAAAVGRVKKISAYSVGTDTVKLKWKRVKKATGYYVYCSTKKSSGFIRLKTVKKGKTVKATIKDLKPNKRYFFRIVAKRGARRSKFSKALKVVTMPENPQSALPLAYQKILNDYKNDEGCIHVYYNTVDLNTLYGRQNALVVTVSDGEYSYLSRVYAVNSEGAAELFLDLQGALSYINAERTDFITYNYQGSKTGDYTFYKYNSISKAYDKKKSYAFDSASRDSITKSVEKKAKGFSLFDYKKCILK